MSDTKKSDVLYELKSIKIPYLSGWILKLFANLIEGPLKGLLLSDLFKSAGITWLREQVYEEAPTLRPFHYAEEITVGSIQMDQKEWPDTAISDAPGFEFASIQDYASAYQEGTTTPEEVAHKALAAIEQSNSGDRPLRAIVAVNRDDVLRQAEAATKRIKNGEAFSILDGVPVAIKDELDMLPYPTTVGTSFLGKAPCKEDSTVVTRMREAGALLIGKANMHEIGIGVTGLNPHHGTPQNPYGMNHFTGGSSSGPGAVVASGLSPVAIGADGGGSIRIPASFCGVVGLKATFGRISEFGAAPLCWSVAHVGPLAASATDAALAYAVMAGSDSKDEPSLHQPMPTLEGFSRLDLQGLTLGVYPEWFQHADEEVVAHNEAMLKKLEARGAEIREISIPDLEAARVAHIVTVGSEMAQALDHAYSEHRQDHGLDVRINLALAHNFKSTDYVKSQRIRTRMLNHLNQIFKEVDVIISPSTGVPAPPMKPAVQAGGEESDLTILTEIMRFATLANLTGNPAISFPVGYTKDGLPVGMQGIGRGWEEATLLRLALNAEQELERRAPERHYKLLTN